MRISAHLRSQLFPYIYTSSEEACAQNVPLDRPVYLDLPNIDAAYHNGQEYLLGDNILVAPIATAPNPIRLLVQPLYGRARKAAVQCCRRIFNK
jgi:alpha-glucosidase (family GH31 glycosyl hydrolase)